VAVTVAGLSLRQCCQLASFNFQDEVLDGDGDDEMTPALGTRYYV
jgi:hypothetical protein